MTQSMTRRAIVAAAPNVVYSCGSMLRDRTLLVPFGVADNFASFGTIKIDDLLSAMS